MRNSRAFILHAIAGIVLASLVIGGVMLVARVNHRASTNVAAPTTSTSLSPNSPSSSSITSPDNSVTNSPAPGTPTADQKPSATASSSAAPATQIPPATPGPTLPGGNPNLQLDVMILVNHVDADVGTPTCFPTPLARMTAHIPGPYKAKMGFASSPSSGPVPEPVTLTPTATANTYDLTPSRCFTFTQPIIEGVSLEVWVDDNQTIPIYGIQFRVGAANQTLSPRSVFPTALSPTAGVPFSVAGVYATFQDVYSTAVQYDQYSEVTDWGDGSPPVPGNVSSQGGQGVSIVSTAARGN